MPTTFEGGNEHLNDNISHHANTDIGKKRTENQDRFGEIIKPNFSVFIVADGMGGVKGGAKAAELAVEAVKKHLEKANNISTKNLKEAIGKANKAIFDFSLDDPALSGMGTTIVITAFTKDQVYLASVGDSRIYRVRKSRSLQLTEDHTLVNELLKAGIINADHMENHPVSHMLTRSLGPTVRVEIDCFLDEPGPILNDTYLLCSDGLYNLVEDQEIAKIIDSNDLKTAAKELIDLANKRGGTDNITIYLIKVEGGVPEYAAEKLDEDLLITESGMHIESEDQAPKDEQAYEKVIFRSSDDPMHYLVAMEEGEEAKQANGKKKAHHQLRDTTLIGLVVISILLVLQIVVPRYFKQERISTNLPAVGFASIQDSETEKDSQVLDKSPEEQVNTIYDNGVLDTDEAITALEKKIEQADRLFAALYNVPLQKELIAEAPQIQKSIEKLKEENISYTSEIAVLTKKMSVWYEQRKKLEEVGPLKLSSELISVSNDIREKQRSFQEATWEYLQAAEKLRETPDDVDLEKQVQSLLRDRKKRMKELELSVYSTIKGQMDSSNVLLTDLTLKKEANEEKLVQANRELSVMQVLIKGNPKEIAKAKEELDKDLRTFKNELQSLKEFGALLE